MGGTFETLTRDEIVEINRRMISRFGGIFFAGDHNLANPGSLDHVLQEIQGSLYGQELYPAVAAKAAVLGWRIIAGHIFHDGNKRTGMEACRLFLELNGLHMRIDHATVEMAVAVAEGKVDLPDFTRWVSTCIG